MSTIAHYPFAGVPLSDWELVRKTLPQEEPCQLLSTADIPMELFLQSPVPGENKKADILPGAPAQGGTYTGTIRMHRDFYSDTLDNKRNVLVYLPPGYRENSGKKYPVLYLADGQNVFNSETSFGGVEWRVDEVADQLMRQGKMKEAIIVAVYNTPDRMDEYTHITDPEYGGGKLDNYAQFLTKELKPFIDSHYRTLTKAENTGVIGSSLGGLSALYMGWTMPNTFSLVGALSPSLWWAGRDIIGRIEHDAQKTGPSRIWLDFGWKESQTDMDHNGIPDCLEDARKMKDVLKGKGYLSGKNLFYFEDPEGGHNEWSWSRRVAMVLMSLLPPEESAR